MEGSGLGGEDLLRSLDYRELEHGGLSWLTNEEGARFVLEVDDWSLQGLALKSEWEVCERRYHMRYLARDQRGKRYFIKVYLPRKAPRNFGRRIQRARREFDNVLTAHKHDIPTVLPLAMAQGKGDRPWGVIIFPFLESVVSLEEVYTGKFNSLSVRERQSMERMVGGMMRRFIDSGMYPRDLVLDHFLVKRIGGGGLSVYWVDLERVNSGWFLKRKKRIEILGKFLLRLERCRITGGRVNSSSMMRIVHAYFHKKALEKLDKRLRRNILRAANKYWYRRKFNKRGPYVLRSNGPED